MPKGPQKEQRALLRLRRQVARAEQALADLDRALMVGDGICPSDLDILERLSRKGGQTVNGLGRRVGLTSGSITTAVQRLQKRGLVETSREEKDRRVVVVVATPEGVELAARVNEQRCAALEVVFQPFGERERELLLGLLKRLRKGAVDHEAAGSQT